MATNHKSLQIWPKGQLISKANCQAVDSPKKTNKQICFFWLEELLGSKVKRHLFVFLENLIFHKKWSHAFEINWPLIVYLFVSTECLKCRIRMDFILPAVVHLCPHLTHRLQACQMDPRVRTRPRWKISRIFGRLIWRLLFPTLLVHRRSPINSQAL